MTVARRALCWLVLLGGLIACNEQNQPDPPARFEQPNAVDFVCVVGGAVVKLEQCAGDNSENNGIALHALVAQHSRGEIATIDFQAYAVLDNRRDIPGYTFVPIGQQPVAVVVPPNHPEFTYVAEYGSRDVRVLRTQSLVGPLVGSPDAQVVPLSVGTGADSVPAAPTKMVLSPDEDALIVTVPDQGRVLWLPIIRCPDAGGGETTDCDDYGLIDSANIATIVLEGSVDRIADEAGPEPSGVRYEKLCGYPEAEPPPSRPVRVSDAMLSAAPRPSALAVDAFCIGDRPCARRILVSDESLPLIHAIDVDAITPGSDGSDALLAPLVVGVATKDVAVTPRVPVAIGSDEETQYVYAIDATDGSVLVTENGRLLNVNAATDARPDRIELADAPNLGAKPVAIALSVMHPLFRLDAPAGQYVGNGAAPGSVDAEAANFYCTDELVNSHSEQDPARLRGVFLAIATAEGGVRIVDVHDMELLEMETEVGGETVLTACRSCPNRVRAPVLIRHHERLRDNFVTEEGADPRPLTLQPTLFSFYVDGVPFPVRPDGTNGSPAAPNLACIACDDGQSVVFPPPDEALEDELAGDADGGVAAGQDRCAGQTPALLCAGDDPWAASEENWLLTYEAVIPGSNGADALFVAPSAAGNRTGSPEITSDLDFCKAGVLGKDTIAGAFTGDSCDEASDPPVGDQVVIGPNFLGSARLKQLYPGQAGDEIVAKCSEAAEELEADNPPKLAFGILRAYADRLVIGERLLTPIGPLRTYEDVQHCLGGEPMLFQVRVHDSFAVTGNLSGFAHDVRTDTAGRCVVDPKADPLHRGRARLGCTFRNHALTLKPRKPGDDDPVDEPPPDTSLVIKMQSPAFKLSADLTNVGGFGSASVVPVQLKYNDIDRFLYLVDIEDRGVVPMPLDPFAPAIDPALSFD